MISAVSSSQFRLFPTGPHRHRARPSTRVMAVVYAPARETLYQVLGIAENGTVSEMKKAYREMARKYHPDVSAPEMREEHTRRFIMARKAYQTLSDPQSRDLYDRNLATGKQGTEEERGYWWRIRWQAQLDELQKRKQTVPTTMSRY